jgi:L-ascorbate metabolism protein UlaG (beta-lactamase superfamily)
MTWRTYTDWAKRKPYMLRLADQLGRGRGRLRFLDSIGAAPPVPMRPDLTRWGSHSLGAVWIGHATVLIRIGGMNVLTDPVFSRRIGIGMGLLTAGPMRKFAPALEIGELPRLDLILISHAHFDHLDRPTLSRLPKRVPVVTAWHTRDLLTDLGFRRVTELRWGETTTIGPLTIRAQEVRHWGARTFFDQHRGYNAYFLEAAGKRILYGADTAYHELFKGMPKADLAIMGIGAYDPYIQAHANPEQAWEMAGHLRADAVMPMHHSTFRLSHEPLEEPIGRILEAAGSGRERVVVQRIGGVWTGD